MDMPEVFSANMYLLRVSVHHTTVAFPRSLVVVVGNDEDRLAGRIENLLYHLFLDDQF
jgi:hypothetical protein